MKKTFVWLGWAYVVYTAVIAVGMGFEIVSDLQYSKKPLGELLIVAPLQILYAIAILPVLFILFSALNICNSGGIKSGGCTPFIAWPVIILACAWAIIGWSVLVRSIWRRIRTRRAIPVA